MREHDGDMINISDHITAVLNGGSINNVPAETRDRVARGMAVRLARHDGHSTVHNQDGTVTVINDRLRVTLPVSEFRGRQDVFAAAMRVLAHRLELQIPTPEPTEAEIQEYAIENLTHEYLVEHCRYNVGETIMRMMGGHRMSEGMAADVEAARSAARRELRENPEHHMNEARQQIQNNLDSDYQYHTSIARCCQNWKIEIIGPMPTQIGMCRFQGVAA
jgi:hypothetical protein